MAIAFVNQTSVQRAASLSHVVTVSSTGGNCLVAVIGLRTGTSQSVSSVTDSAGNTWTPGPAQAVTGVNSRVEIWYALNAAAVTSVTVTPTASLSAAINIVEFSGVATAAASDGSATASNSALTAILSGSITTTNAEDVLIAGMGTVSTTTLSSVDGGYTALTGQTATGTLMGMQAAYQIVAATGAYQATFNMSASTTAGGANLALKAAAAAGGRAPVMTPNRGWWGA